MRKGGWEGDIIKFFLNILNNFDSVDREDMSMYGEDWPSLYNNHQASPNLLCEKVFTVFTPEVCSSLNIH